MTWEIVTLLSVSTICWTCLALFRKRPDTTSASAIADLRQSIYSVSAKYEADRDAIERLLADHEHVAKLAEETKKLLSQQNLVVGLGGRR